MCGILGSINFPLDLDKTRNLLRHRGPDEQSEYHESNVWFNHFRLSILDVAGGKQPMHRNDLVVIFNGELYNHKEVREKYNLQCSSNSDTETLLAAYEKYGTKALSFFDGMFAIALYDKRERKIVLARDRAGKKPLYIYKKNEEIVFASELRALQNIVKLELDKKSISSYFRFGFMYNQETPYSNVQELQGGHYAVIDTETASLEIKKWWSIDSFYATENNLDFQESMSQVDDILINSVQRRIDSSDLEVGSFLSGGIDSGLVTAIGAQIQPNIKTFTVTFNGQYDEAPLAKLVSNKYNTDHTEINIDFNDLESDIIKIITNYGEPYCDSSSIPSYYVSKAAKEHITVVLNGDGADELFGGYRRYVPFKHANFFNLSPSKKKLIEFLFKSLPTSNSKKSYYNYLYRLLDFARKDGPDLYLSASSDIFEGYQENLNADSISSNFIGDFERIVSSSNSSLKKIMELDFNTILFGDLLVKMDIATMAHSLEGRSPFMSKEMLEFAPTINDKFKINKKQTKFILRELGRKYMPAELIDQPKRGFEIPLKDWVNTNLKEVIFSYLDADCLSGEFVNRSFIERLKYKGDEFPQEKRAKMLWSLFSFEVWYRNLAKHA